MQSDAFTLYKLIILYILDKVDFPLTNAQMSNFILEKEYTNYFTIQQAISELTDSKLITCETIRNSSRYEITDSGRETLSFFGNKVSEPIKNDILEFLHKNKYALRNEVANIADYYLSTNDEFVVRCQVKEKDTSIIDLSVTVPTEKEATAICNNWKTKSQEVYSYILRTLMMESH